MNNPLIQLTKAHLKEYIREPGAVFWSFGFPILMALGLGMAFSSEKGLTHSVALVPGEYPGNTMVSERLFDGKPPSDTTISKSFAADVGTASYVFYINSWDEAVIKLKRGIVNMILTESRNEITYHYDPSNPEAELVKIQLESYFETGHIQPVVAEVKPIDTKGLRYIDFLIPGLLAMGTMMSVMWGVCYTLIEKRSKKLLRRMVATPMRKSVYLMSQWLSRLSITFAEMLALMVFALVIFNIEIQGSILAFVLLFLAGNLCFFGLAILISSKTANTQVGNGLISFVTTPMIVLSGIFFSYQNFPPFLESIVKWLPLTRFADELRSTMNEGAGLIDALDGIAILGGFGLICFFIGLRIYKWY